MKKYDVGFVVAGSVMTIIFLMLVNYLTSFQHLWFIYPAFALLLSLFGILFIQNKKLAVLSILSSMLMMIFLFVQNYLYTPNHPWFLYAVAPIVIWPILTLLGKTCKNDVHSRNWKYVNHSILFTIKPIFITSVSMVDLSDFCCAMVAAFTLSRKEKVLLQIFSVRKFMADCIFYNSKCRFFTYCYLGGLSNLLCAMVAIKYVLFLL